MAVTTGLSGNEIFCLAQKGYRPGNIVIGNSVYSLGILRGITSGLKALAGGELGHLTELIEDGRETAIERMVQEAQRYHASGITGVSSEVIFHGSNIEFLSIGSAVFADGISNQGFFSTSADGQELYAQMDTGFQPVCFAFGNVAYSMGLGRGLIGGLKQFARGEIKEYSDMFNHTRHLALTRIIDHAKLHRANAVLGIKTTILSYGGVSEMMMMGTASNHTGLPTSLTNDMMTSDMTNIEMWNMAAIGYTPMRLLLGTSVYSLGLAGGITAALKSFVRGEINEITTMIYDARENALGIINDEAKAIGADDVVGVKTYVYQLGNGLIEFLAIGTAVKKTDAIKTLSPQLPPQAIVVDRNTFFDANDKGTVEVDVSSSSKPINTGSFINIIILFLFLFIYIFIKFSHK